MYEEIAYDECFRNIVGLTQEHINNSRIREELNSLNPRNIRNIINKIYDCTKCFGVIDIGQYYKTFCNHFCDKFKIPASYIQEKHNDFQNKAKTYLKSIKIIDIYPDVNSDEVNEASDIYFLGYVFEKLSDANFLDFDPRDNWYDAIKLLSPISLHQYIIKKSQTPAQKRKHNLGGKSSNGNKFGTLERGKKTLQKAISSWKSYYYNKKGSNIKSGKIEEYEAILFEIASSLGFDYIQWGIDINKDNLNMYIEQYKNNYIQKQNLKLDLLKEYIPDSSMSKEESRTLEKLTQNIKDMDFVKDEFSQGKISKLINATPSSEFLYNLLIDLYHNGYYAIIDIFIIDKILDSNLTDTTEFKLFKAHIWGAVGKYDKSLRLLNSLDIDNMTSLVDIKTSLVSNILRKYLSDVGYAQSSLDQIASSETNLENFSKNEKIKSGLHIFLDEYKNIFYANKNHHYYPGINYAYMLSLYELIYDTTYGDTTKNIYELSTTSIIDEKEAPTANINNRYYPMISDLEFQALLGNFDQDKFNAMIKESNPTKDQLSRTLRQLIFYQDILDVFDRSEKCPNSIKSLDTAIREEL